MSLGSPNRWRLVSRQQLGELCDTAARFSEPKAYTIIARFSKPMAYTNVARFSEPKAKTFSRGSPNRGLTNGGRHFICYLELVEWTARLWRQGKARMSTEVAWIMERLGTSAEFWEARMKKLLGKSRLLGSYFATRSDRFKEIATQRGVHHVDNAVGGLEA
ncbi:MAG TPA: hypothetical protein PKA83_19320 [Pirellulaceae bacterium]|nr:hypothetical protein [Pirellulaceae bacterium]